MIMEGCLRRSPVSFKARALKTEKREGWLVVLEYEDEAGGPWLIDLSHRPKFDIQDAKIDEIKPWGITIPQIPGHSVFEKGMLVNRMNRTQVSVWHLGGHAHEVPAIAGLTDVTDAGLMLALVGEWTFSILEKLSDMDLLDPRKTPPFLIQGPLCRVPCQIVVLRRSSDRSAVLWTCARGYAQDMVHAVMQAGEEHGIRAGGENLLSSFTQSVA